MSCLEQLINQQISSFEAYFLGIKCPPIEQWVWHKADYMRCTGFEKPATYPETLYDRVDRLIEVADSAVCLLSQSEYIRERKKIFLLEKAMSQLT